MAQSYVDSSRNVSFFNCLKYEAGMVTVLFKAIELPESVCYLLVISGALRTITN